MKNIKVDCLLQLAFLEPWLQKTLDFWHEKSYNKKGFWHEGLDFSGKPIKAPCRLLVQARQNFVFYNGGVAFSKDSWRQEDTWKRISSMESHYYKNYDWISTNSSSNSDSSFANLYSLAHVLLCYSVHASYEDKARELYQYLALNFLDSTFGGFYAQQTCDVYPELPLESRFVFNCDKLQNPIMHLFEACLALAWQEYTQAVAGKNVDYFWLRTCGELFELLERFQHASSFVGERYSRTFTSKPFSVTTKDLEPQFQAGHQFEWSWLLGEYSRLLTCQQEDNVQEYNLAYKLWKNTCKFGLNKQEDSLHVLNGLNCPDLHLSPMDLENNFAPGRIWAQCEGIQATCWQIAHGKLDLSDLEHAWTVLSKLLKTLKNWHLGQPFEFGWIDKIDAQGQSLDKHVPASALYHISGAILDLYLLDY